MADTCAVDSVLIYGWVSPEGSPAFNVQLAQDRAEELAALVRWQWPGARVLDIRGMGVDYSIEQVREKWPLMRRADAVIWYHPIPRGGQPGASSYPYPGGYPGGPEGGQALPHGRDTVWVFQKDTVFMAGMPSPAAAAAVREPASQEPVWALKTNLLLLGVAAPNLQAEFPLGTGNRWSVEAEIICPWWTFAHNAYAEQLLNFGLETRLWLGRRQYHRCLDGWHIGLAAALGYYDLEWKSEGFQGEHVNAYLNFGYQHRWGSRGQWGVDAGIGLGVLYSPRHRHYLGSTLFPENHTEQYDDHLMYRNKGTLVWPGASHVNVTLMYLFNLKRKEGGR